MAVGMSVKRHNGRSGKNGAYNPRHNDRRFDVGNSGHIVFDCENRYGEICPQQEKALEKLGIPLPDPNKPKGKNNNRKQIFDAACREMLFDITKKHGLRLDKEPEYGGRGYLEKQDYVLMKQNREITERERELEKLALKIEEVERLVDEVSEIAYDNAVEIVMDAVRLETQREDLAA